LKKENKAVKFVLNQPGLEGWFKNFPKRLKTLPDKSSVVLPESFATGYARVWKIFEGLTCRMVDYQLNSDFSYAEPASKEFYLIIYLYNYRNCSYLKYEVNDKIIIENREPDYSSLLMTNSLVNQRFKISRGAYVQGLTIEMKKDWLLKKINPSSKINLEVLEQRDIFQTMIKPPYRLLINEIFHPNPHSHVPDLYLSSRILRLLELFFNEIFTNGLEANILPVSSSDVQSLFAVEQYLSQHYQSPFPTVSILSRMAMMSNTKLKMTFKKAFGTGLFEYFQRNRMARAKELLKSNLYTVGEVGEMLGYKNMSNFSVAFKKEYKVLPKDVAQLP